MRRVVITGMGAITPLGNSVDTYWKGLLSGQSGTGRITLFDAADLPVKIAAEIKGWDPADHFSRREINRYDRLTLLALTAADEAVKMSDLLKEDLYDPLRTGIIWASGNGGIESIETTVREMEKSPGSRISPYFIPRSLLDTPSGEIALHLGFKGINHAVVAACASSNAAIMTAANMIRFDQADLMVAGGSEAPVTPILIAGFGAMKALSQRNEDATSASRPLDETRDGFVMGEGAGALVVEELEHAKRRNATILAEICGAAETNDAYHSTATHPEGEGAARAMRIAIHQAGLNPADINYINLHATGTAHGDISEMKAIIEVFGQQIPWLSAGKAATGHLLGASGAIEAISVIKSLQSGEVPPTINLQSLDPQLPANLKLGPSKISDIRYAMSNNFGFGGHNVSVLFANYLD